MRLKRPCAGSLLLLLAVGLPTGARAQGASTTTPPPADEAPSVKVGAVVYTDFTYVGAPIAEDADRNPVHGSAFNVGRAYINVTGTLSRRVSFRVTPDVAREGGSGSSLSGSLTFRLKYALGQLTLEDWLGRGSWVRLGAQQTPYVDFMEGLYRYRFQGTIFEEREGFLTSSDFGLSGRYNLPGDYGDVHAGIYNGDGYARAEANDQKAFQVRATLRPFPAPGTARGLRLTAFLDHDHYLARGPRRRLVANASFEHPHLVAAVHYLSATDRPSVARAPVEARGWSVWATPRLRVSTESRSGLEGLVRYEDLRPDVRLDAHRRRLILGLAYWLPVRRGLSVALLADMDRATFDRALARPGERRYALHALLGS